MKLQMESPTPFKLIGSFVCFSAFYASFFYESFQYLVKNDRRYDIISKHTVFLVLHLMLSAATIIVTK